MATTRIGKGTWSGDLLGGAGRVSAGTTGVFADLPVTWAARTGEPAGVTSPEELLAAAHAACYSMACSNILAKAGTPPTRLDVEVAVTADRRDSGWTVVSAHILVRGSVPGATAESFAAAAAEAKDGCPISKALKGNVELSVEATLEG
ncbi:MAG: OsmC family peroxiredoxin [Chloroflexi bacterium]|nr:OsmC family peroxiredoxin [Chloroflexota bacterium]